MTVKTKKSLLEHVALLNDEVSKKNNNQPHKLKSFSIEVVEPPKFNKDKVVSLRAKLGLTQKMFAFVIGVSPRTVESWERGATSPKANSERLMSFIEEEPRLVDKVLKTN